MNQPSFEHAVLEQALKKLFGDSHFSICTLDKIGELIGVNPKAHGNYRFLHALHCVDYSSMSDAIKNQLQHKVMECLRPQFEFSAGVLARALVIEGNSYTPIEDEFQFKTKRLS